MVRMRSPNFPGLSLEDSVKSVKSIWDKNRRAPISREAGAKDLGYTGLTGRSLKVLGALNQYDLIENLSKGQMRVTKTAEDILIGFPEEIKREAVSAAGRAPSLYREIYERFEGHIPGDNAVRSFLFQRGFTNEGVEKALKTFLETNRYIEINGVSESYGQEGDDEAESAPDHDFQEQPKMAVAVASPITASASRQFYGGGAVIDEGPLDFSLTSTGLALYGKTKSARSLKAFILKLEALAALLPDDDRVETEDG
jgi:hypothetical protein